MENDFYVRLLEFFFSWDTTLIIQFIEAEKAYLPKGEVLRTEYEFSRMTEEEILREYLDNEGYMVNFSRLFNDKKVFELYHEYDRKKYLEWLPWDYKYIMISMKKGYALEWLYLFPTSPYETVKHYIDLNNDNDFQKWVESFIKSNSRRKDVLSKTEDIDKYLCFRLMRKDELLLILFYGLNQHHLFIYYDEIIGRLVENRLLNEVKDIYKKIWKSEGGNQQLFNYEVLGLCRYDITRHKATNPKKKSKKGGPAAKCLFVNEEKRKEQYALFCKYIEVNPIEPNVFKEGKIRSCELSWIALAFVNAWKDKSYLKGPASSRVAFSVLDDLRKVGKINIEKDCDKNYFHDYIKPKNTNTKKEEPKYTKAKRKVDIFLQEHCNNDYNEKAFTSE